MTTIMHMSTAADRIRSYRFRNLTGQHAVDAAYLLLDAGVGEYPDLGEEDAVAFEVLARDQEIFYLYFASHPHEARDVVQGHWYRGLGQLGWYVFGYLFGNALYRWKYQAARRALSEQS
jgi:hypothetical protein